MCYLTFANTFGILKSSDVGFASITFRVQECPGRVTVPDDSVVHYYLEQQRESQHVNACVLSAKQGSHSNSVARTAPEVTASGETGEEAMPPSARIKVWAASLVLRPAQPSVRQSTA